MSRSETRERGRRGGAETESAKKSAEAVLTQQIEEEEEQLHHNPTGLLLSGLSAGLDLGFGPFLMAVVLTFAGGDLSDLTTRILAANAYAVGYILVILGGSELFTEHTTLAVFPVLDRRASVGDLARLWGLIYVGNLVGAALFAGLAALIGPGLGVIERSAFATIAEEMVRHSWWVMLLSAMLTGWMLGLVAWLVAAGRETISEAFFVWIVAAGIGFAGLHHSIAGTIEVLMGVISGVGAGLGDYARFLLWATLGNALGGVVFVALIKYGHVAQSTSPTGRLGRR